jgi:hypothetical protein
MRRNTDACMSTIWFMSLRQAVGFWTCCRPLQMFERSVAVRFRLILIASVFSHTVFLCAWYGEASFRGARVSWIPRKQATVRKFVSLKMT